MAQWQEGPREIDFWVDTAHEDRSVSNVPTIAESLSACELRSALASE
jgi:hypothetical protein